MRVDSAAQPTRAKVVSAGPGRIRVRIDAPRGQGKLHQLEEQLNRLPETRAVRANHLARSVTVTYDPAQASAPSLLDHLQRLGLLVLDLADPEEWGEMLIEHVVPHTQDPATLPGRLNRQLLLSSAGRINLVHVSVGLLLVTAALQVRGALARGHAIPWLRVVTYLLAAASIWNRHREGVTQRV
jgi:hypothetical protein